MADNKTIGIIPARFGSSRLPGKMLVDILGKSLLQRTYENTTQSGLLDKVVVATDDRRISEHVKGFGGVAFMTSAECESGTDRVAEVVEREFSEAEIVVNIQGDEPCLDPEVIDTLIEALRKDEVAVLTTPVVPITGQQEIFNPSVVKCVFDQKGRALYFSRSPLPFKGKRAFRHMGVYCFRREFLLHYRTLKPTPCQEAEDLEQLKVLEHGYPIHVCVVEDEGVEVNTPEDLKRLESKLCKESTSLSQEALSPR